MNEASSKAIAEESMPDDLSRMVVRIQAGVLAFVFAVVCGAGLFLMTLWLLIKGGQNVGSHLNLLGQYFPGYKVTWAGSFVGLFYGAIVGAVIGWAIAKIYNRIAHLRQR